MCKAFFGEWREGKLWITLWGEKVVGGEDSIRGVF